MRSFSHTLHDSYSQLKRIQAPEGENRKQDTQFKDKSQDFRIQFKDLWEFAFFFFFALVLRTFARAVTTFERNYSLK